MERWLPVVGAEGRYEVSDLGRVRSVDRIIVQRDRRYEGGTVFRQWRGKVLRPGPSTAGHLTVMLGRGLGSRQVHALVLEAFTGPAPAGCEARHLNGTESDNRWENLVWDTRGNNTRDKKWHRGTTLTKLRPPQVREIKQALKTGGPRGFQNRLAEKYGVSAFTISAIKHGLFHIDVSITGE